MALLVIGCLVPDLLRSESVETPPTPSSRGWVFRPRPHDSSIAPIRSPWASPEQKFRLLVDVRYVQICCRLRIERNHVLKRRGMTEGQETPPAESVHAREHLIPGVIRQPLYQLIDRAGPSPCQPLKNRRFDLTELCHCDPPFTCSQRRGCLRDVMPRRCKSWSYGEPSNVCAEDWEIPQKKPQDCVTLTHMESDLCGCKRSIQCVIARLKP